MALSNNYGQLVKNRGDERIDALVGKDSTTYMAECDSAIRERLDCVL
jgi:hypothetical protein